MPGRTAVAESSSLRDKMTLKRVVLGILTTIVVLLVGSSLLGSLGKPQITSQLQLYQTNLLLSATEIQQEAAPSSLQSQLQQAILGENPLDSALEQYQEVRETATEDLESFQARTAMNDGALDPEMAMLVQQQQTLLRQLDLQIGVLQAAQGDVAAAQATWESLTDESGSGVADTAALLQGLWSAPPQVPDDAESDIRAGLNGWFEVTALQRLYTVTDAPEALARLNAEQGAIAQNTLIKLALIGILPGIAAITGIGLLIFLIAQRLSNKKDALLTLESQPWEVPWNWEVTLQVIIVGFFFVGQIVVPLILSLTGTSIAAAESSRLRGLITLVYYLTMAAAGLLVLFFSVRSYRPLPQPWFHYRPNLSALSWGIGGYVAALPIMLGVSLLNQQIWQGQGGSNPLLQIVLEENDPLALGMFLFTAAVAAPIFEETLFRGFLLPSLTRYMPVWGAIALSSGVFAIAHLSLSEVLPLMALGSMLGFVYWRSRNLLAPILFHGLWNSVTMIGLFILGSGT